MDINSITALSSYLYNATFKASGNAGTAMEKVLDSNQAQIKQAQLLQGNSYNDPFTNAMGRTTLSALAYYASKEAGDSTDWIRALAKSQASGSQSLLASSAIPSYSYPWAGAAQDLTLIKHISAINHNLNNYYATQALNGAHTFSFGEWLNLIG